MTFAEFQASRQRLEPNSPLVPEYIAELIANEPHCAAVWLYKDGLYILEEDNGLLWLHLERDEYMEGHLEPLERLLYAWREANQ